MLAEVKAYLRIATGDEDGVLGAMIAAASGLCEDFVGQWLVARDGEQMLPVTQAWQRLAARPVRDILSVEGVSGAGDAVALPIDGYAVDIDANGDGWVRVTRPVAVTRMRVRYRAGLAPDEAGLPATIRQGIVRMAAEQYMRRDAMGREAGDPDPPAAVAALWRPFRRMRLS